MTVVMVLSGEKQVIGRVTGYMQFVRLRVHYPATVTLKAINNCIYAPAIHD
jgi:hypothetical protein